MIKNTLSFVFGYNSDKDFEVKAYKAGMFAYFTLTTPDEEFSAKLIPALNIASSMQKNALYRDILVENKVLAKNNEVFLDCNNILDREINNIKNSSSSAVLAAISPDEKKKFGITSNQIETVILNNIRKTDLLINYAANKYFLLLNDTDIDKAKTIWRSMSKKFAIPMYAGLASIHKKSRQQVVNEVLNNLHQEINNGFNSEYTANVFSGDNFVKNRRELCKKFKQIITPVFYHLQQTYNDKLFNMKIEPIINDDYSLLRVISKHLVGNLKISNPGFASVNIEIFYEAAGSKIDSVVLKNKSLTPKRIVLEPDEFEAGLLQDLAEQFLTEFKSEAENEYSGRK